MIVTNAMLGNATIAALLALLALAVGASVARPPCGTSRGWWCS